jgi:hypothetical protein
MNLRKAFLPLLAALAFATPAQAASVDDVVTLGKLVKQTGTEIVFGRCSDGEQGHYVLDKANKVDRLTICENNVDLEDPDEVWEVMAHEATHVMQACLGENVIKDQYIARMHRELRTQAPHYSKIVATYPSAHQLHEAEAFWMELQTPDVVMNIFSSACFNDN